MKKHGTKTRPLDWLRTGMTVLGTVLTIGIFGGAAQAATSVILDATALTSALGVPGDGVGAAKFYDYDVTDGATIIDTIPVKICIVPTPTWTTGSSFTSYLDPNGSGFPGTVTVTDLPFTFAAYAAGTYTDPVTGDKCQTTNIQINTGVIELVNANIAEDFALNFNIKDKDAIPSSGSNKLNVTYATTSTKTIHLRVHVKPAAVNISCFMTDSEGLPLADCDGNAITVSGSDLGRFAIVANKKNNKEVATNPGQFYYNLTWKNNTAATQVVNVNFDRTYDDGNPLTTNIATVLPHGTQAIHAYVGNGLGLPLSSAEFDLVNSIGIAEGADDKILNISVSPGNSLYATYHLSYAGIGSTVPAGCATTCPTANQPISIKATVSGTGITPEVCTSGAWGFRKSS